jgi:hypothetical protein
MEILDLAMKIQQQKEALTQGGRAIEDLQIPRIGTRKKTN